jgi:predicted metalloenzyme YecM
MHQRGEMKLQLRATREGLQKIKIPLKLKVPGFDDSTRILLHYLPPMEIEFDVKTSKLVFLQSNKTDISLSSENQKEGVEIELDYSPQLELNKTYRLEKQEKPGGFLVAEIFTKSVLSNGRVLCQLRTYNLHRQSEGYLYLKDGDEAYFITNFDITPPMKIDEVTVLPKKGNYSSGNKIYAGETLDVRIKGEGLYKARFTFDGLSVLPSDSLLRTEKEMIFSVQVPLRINKSQINILNYNAPTGKVLKVEEFQVAHQLDFVKLDLGESNEIVVDEIEKTIFADHTIPDILIQFDPDRIDSKDRLFGKQYLEIEVVVTDKNNRLLDKQTIPAAVICPGESSPRFDYYDTKNCGQEAIRLNRYLRQKTFDLEGWDRIEVIIQHDRTKHGDQGFYKKAEIILRQKSSFDLDVSFPAGLVTKKIGTEGFGNLSGVSMAIVAQFSFYHPDRIAKPRPFKVGVGFLAFNAFNFAENATNRDVGIVLLGSLYPIPSRDRSKLSFPLYLGGGYFLSESKFFFLLGPGIRVRI